MKLLGVLLIDEPSRKKHIRIMMRIRKAFSVCRELIFSVSILEQDLILFSYINTYILLVLYNYI